MPIWESAYLNQLLEDAEDYITASIDCIFDRFSFPVISGQSVYTLPSYVTRLVRITWKGKKLYPLNFQEFCILNPASAVVSAGTKIESPNSIPLYYVKHPTNYYDIRLYPTPGEDLAQVTTDLWGANINTGLIVSCYRTQSRSADYLHLSNILIRRIKKAYLLVKAFAKEGKGQNIQASQYYQKKLDLLLGALKEINSNVFLGKIRILNDTFNASRFGTPGRPVLPSDYEIQ